MRKETLDRVQECMHNCKAYVDRTCEDEQLFVYVAVDDIIANYFEVMATQPPSRIKVLAERAYQVDKFIEAISHQLDFLVTTAGHTAIDADIGSKLTRLIYGIKSIFAVALIAYDDDYFSVPAINLALKQNSNFIFYLKLLGFDKAQINLIFKSAEKAVNIYRDIIKKAINKVVKV